MEARETGTEVENRIMANHPELRRLLYRWGHVPTLSDSLPGVFSVIVTSGKLSGLGFLAVYLVFILLWLPFWLLSFLITEFGVYAFAIMAIFYFGRVVIRMIAFPGASTKVVSEVESEFAKYSVRMLIAAASCLRDLASAVSSTANGNQTSSNGSGSRSGSGLSCYEIPGLWKRAKSYKDRALGVYLEVLSYIYEPPTPVQRQSSDQRTKFGSNRLMGDIGNLSGLTPQAREDGRELMRQLSKTLDLMSKLEEQMGSVLHGTVGIKPTMISDEARTTASHLFAAANELRDFVTSLKPPSSDENSGNDEDITADAMRRRVEEQSSGSMLDAVKSGLSSILPMLDPPPHASIFGFDVLRGTVLSRYLGARQMWVQRPSGGMLDVIHIPGKQRGPNMPLNPKAVMYCNPNAGLYEVATGMSLAGGNIGEEADSNTQDNCWTDFYTDLGYDIYIFNYAGFGRSFGTTMCVAGRHADESYEPGLLGRLRRIFRASFLTFVPTPDTLRHDGVALANYIVGELGVESLIIHGESIGGVAASRTAQSLSLSPSTRSKIALLICDRTFCNLEAVAQRLVGNWSGYAIRALAPTWSTDVCGDFLTANCPKVVANDVSDAIVADTSSLKTGVAIWREIQRGATTTKGLGWVMEVPLEYRMADWENVCVVESQYVAPSLMGKHAPTWPQDKHISLSEAFHFAACAKRIGKCAKEENSRSTQGGDEGGMEMGYSFRNSSSPIKSAWEILACVDGLCGAPLGMAVKSGFDSTISWLCCTLTYGGQVVASKAERRLAVDNATTLPNAENVLPVIPSDFDQRPEGYEQQETGKMVHPKPLPEVLEKLRASVASESDSFSSVKHEISFVIGMLEYVIARLSSPPIIQASLKCIHCHPEETMVGTFLNLHCGHNNPFSKSERQHLKEILQKTSAPPPALTG